MKIRSICLGLCLFATAAFGAAGEYQQTRDSKTTVWNGSPKPGESASWAGARDKDGYATGFGTITWYNANGTVYAVYYGNMVNGKLEGPVNVHMGRRTAHSYFADGGRVTAWARGSAPSKMNVPEALVAKRRKAESEQPKPREERQVKKETTEKPAVAAAKPKPTLAEPERTEPPRTEPSPESTASPPAVAEETRTVPTPEPTQSAASLMEPPKIAEAHESPSSFANDTPPMSTPEPSVEQKPEPPQESATPEETKKSNSEGSLSELTGPPSSLRGGGSISESSAPAKSEAKSKSSGARGVAELSEDESIGLADTEARARGYDLSQYQRPKADYSAVKDKWSLFYNLKDPKTAGGDLQPFSVTVEDKTKKVEIRKNY
ncbi:MAG TPA: hypothetical protein VLK27_05155 [Chthoniobacterales bacterium]|nr:hypothetical protein [Chthoniobacterales bacterium]